MNPLLIALESHTISSRQFKSGFGVCQENFEQILHYFEPIWQQKNAEELANRWANKKRKKKVGSGKPAKLPTARACLGFVLYYLKQYPTFDALGLIFNMTGGRANHLFHCHRHTLMQALDQMNVLPRTSFESVAAFQKFLKDNQIDEILADATERAIQRPVNQQRQEDHYSGKKKDIRSKILS